MRFLIGLLFLTSFSFAAAQQHTQQSTAATLTSTPTEVPTGMGKAEAATNAPTLEGRSSPASPTPSTPNPPKATSQQSTAPLLPLKKEDEDEK